MRRRRGSILHELRNDATDDVVLADRVRSSVGPLLKELDTPRIHVMAEGNRVLLHGEVVDGAARAWIEEAVRNVEGVGTVANVSASRVVDRRVASLAGPSRHPVSGEPCVP